MKPKLWALYDGAFSLVNSFRSKTAGDEALKEFRDGAFLKPYYFLTAGQVEQLRYHEATSVESVFQSNYNEKLASR